MKTVPDTAALDRHEAASERADGASRVGSDHRPIRVCFPFVGDDLGGSHVSAAKLVANLDRSRVKPVVVLQHADGPVAAFLKREGLDYVHLPLPELLSATAPMTAMRGYVLQTLPRIRRFLRDGRFDIVHTNDGRTHVNWGLAARLAGTKLVWHHRGDPDAWGANHLAPVLAHQMATVSRFSRPSRPVLPLKDRLHVVHSPFDHPPVVPDREAAKAALLLELGLPQQTRILGYFGGLIERKRPLLFVDVVHRFRERHPNIPVVGCLFGVCAPDGRHVEDEIRDRAARLGIGEAIRLMGYRTPVEPFMAATDVLLVTAMGEPFGRTLIEAMFLRTPVVATDHGGNREAIRDGANGYLVEPENADAFVEPVAALLRDPGTAERITGAAREEALRRYGTSGHVDQIMTLYGRALRRTDLSAAGRRAAGRPT